MAPALFCVFGVSLSPGFPKRDQTSRGGSKYLETDNHFEVAKNKSIRYIRVY